MPLFSLFWLVLSVVSASPTFAPNHPGNQPRYPLSSLHMTTPCSSILYDICPPTTPQCKRYWHFTDSEDRETVDRPTVLGCLNLVRTGDIGVRDAVESLRLYGIQNLDDLVWSISLEEVEPSTFLPDETSNQHLFGGLGVQMPFDGDGIGEILGGLFGGGMGDLLGDALGGAPFNEYKEALLPEDCDAESAIPCEQEDEMDHNLPPPNYESIVGNDRQRLDNTGIVPNYITDAISQKEMLSIDSQVSNGTELDGDLDSVKN